MEQHHLKAAIVRVLIDGEELVTIARGQSMGGVPVTPEMHFRNGAVASTYMSTALLVLVDRGVVSLEDPLSIWLPDLPDADKATLRMLANRRSAGLGWHLPSVLVTAATLDRAWGRHTWAGNRDRRVRGGVRSARARCGKSGIARTRRRVRTATLWQRRARCRSRPRTREETCRLWRPIGQLPLPSRTRRLPHEEADSGIPGNASRC